MRSNLSPFPLFQYEKSSSYLLVLTFTNLRKSFPNLAAQSHVQVSFDSPEFTADVDAVGVLRILEAVRQLGMVETCRIYQASTSELYGKVEEVPQKMPLTCPLTS